ncbi:ankyrin repeat domain-containing protein [bacterium]|nr:ankyrin repeat domain-containing protein [bacterium]
MKLFLFVAFISLCLLSCSKKQEELFTVRIAIGDSAMTWSDGKMIMNLDSLPGSWEIPALSDSLGYVQAARNDSEYYSGRTYSSRLIVDVRKNVASQLLVMMVYNTLRNQFNETRLLWTLPDHRVLEIPVLAMQGYGLNHQVNITPTDIWMATYLHPVYEAPPDLPPDDPIPYSLEKPLEEQKEKTIDQKQAKQLTAKRAHRARAQAVAATRPSSFGRVSHPIKIARVDGQLNIAEFRTKLAWLTAELGKIGYVKGRHFNISVNDQVPASEFFEVAEAIIGSIPNETPLQKAAIWDMAPPPPPQAPGGAFRYLNGLTASFRDFSISIGRNIISEVREDSSGADGSPNHDLLCIGGLLYTAIEDSNMSRTQLILDYGMDVNSYAFDGLEVQRGQYDDEEVKGQERRQDWHGYTPLLLAVSKNQADVVRFLIRHNADVNRPSKTYTYKWGGIVVANDNFTWKTNTSTEGRIISPLKLALEKKNEEIVKILQEAGAK